MATDRPSRPWWPWLRRGLTALFFLGVGTLLSVSARRIEWSEVGQALQALPPGVLALAGLLALVSYGIFSSYDLAGRHYTGHRLPVRSVVLVNFISYAFNLNLGAMVGGVAFRYRLYSRLGLDPGTTTRVITLSMITNWIGYAWLFGGVLLMAPPELPEGWEAGTLALRAAGAGFLAVGIAYVLLCAFKAGRVWTVRGHEIEVPGPRMALVQVALSCLNWSVMALMIWVLLRGEIAWPTVLSVLLVAAVAGVLTHVPAGLGVLEAVFLAFLASDMAQGPLLAALLAYRGLYYILPLVLATIAYLVTEARAHRLKGRPHGEAGAPAARDARTPACPATATGR